MKAQKLLRQIHRWASPLIMLPLGLVIATGILLMLKKDIDWIQPPTARGQVADQIPTQSFEALFAAASGVPQLELSGWGSLDRVDVKPDKGVVKFVAANGWEAQVDTATAEVVQVAYRRSDLIESLHDGSFFAGWTKKWVFLPSGVVLLVLWGTGIYLFFLPHWKRRQKRLARRS
ncbi:PepSY domain-containing protein [Parvularcula maris]|uniref:PepSY domain-containing protein n=1 Tax=Parvularcula maris TaxID=2965077 RepID=A0A9X2L7Y0_9PROT|nr:PepSY domain-containing protein [Parvularcula maris]